MKLSPSSRVLAVSGVLGLATLTGIGVAGRADLSLVDRGPAIEVSGTPNPTRPTVTSAGPSAPTPTERPGFADRADGGGAGEQVPPPTPVRLGTGESPPSAQTT